MDTKKLLNTKSLVISLILGIPIAIISSSAFPNTSFWGNVLDVISIYFTVVSFIYLLIYTILMETPHRTLQAFAGRLRNAIRRWLLGTLTGQQSNHIQRTFIGRITEQKCFDDIVKNLGTTVWALMIYGFSGNGKTTLMEQMAISARKYGVLVYTESLARTRVRGTGEKKPERRALESLPAFLTRTLKMDIVDSTNKSPFTQLDIIIKHLDRTIIFIDEYPYYDEEWNQQFTWLVDNLQRKHMKMLFITASRVKPPLSINLPIQYILLGGLSFGETQEYIKEWSETDFYPDVNKNFAAFYNSTQGNPKIIQLLFANPNARKQFIQPRNIGQDTHTKGKGVINAVNAIEDLFEEIWNDIDSVTLKEDIALLVVLAHVSLVFSEKIARQLVANWAYTYREMVQRSLLSEVPIVNKLDAQERQFRIHDLFGDWMYNHINDARSYHDKVGEVYAHFSKDPVANFLSLQHFILSGNNENIQKVYSSVARDKFQRGEISQMVSLTDGILDLHIIGTGDFNLMIMLHRAKALLLSGRILDALEQFEEIESMARSKTLRIQQEAELYMGMADCYRLSGNSLDKTKHYFGLAAERLKQEGNEEDAIAAEVEYGHAFYMEGNAVASLNIYQKAQDFCLLNRQCERRLGDVYYRISKSRRLLGQYGSALAACTKAEEFYEKYGDKVGIAKARWTKVSVLRLQEKYAEAMLECNFVGQLFRDTGYRARMFLMHDIGEIHRAMGHFDEALTTYEEALRAIRIAGVDIRVAQSLLGIAEVKRWRSQSIGLEADGSSIDYDEPLEMFETLESKWGIINTRIARALSCWPKWEKAQSDLECVLALLSGIDLPLERQMVERIGKTYVPQLNPLNFV